MAGFNYESEVFGETDVQPSDGLRVRDGAGSGVARSLPVHCRDTLTPSHRSQATNSQLGRRVPGRSEQPLWARLKDARNRQRAARSCPQVREAPRSAPDGDQASLLAPPPPGSSLSPPGPAPSRSSPSPAALPSCPSLSPFRACPFPALNTPRSLPSARPPPRPLGSSWATAHRRHPATAGTHYAPSASWDVSANK